MGATLGISDWNTATLDDVRAAAAEFVTSEAGENYFRREAEKRVLSSGEGKVMPMPETLSSELSDGVYRYREMSSGRELSVIKDAYGYTLYDHSSGNVSRSMSYDEMKGAFGTAKEKAASATKAEAGAKWSLPENPDIMSMLENKKGASQLSNVKNDPAATSVDDSVVAPKYSIPENGKKVNTSEKKTATKAELARLGERYALKRDSQGEVYVEVKGNAVGKGDAPKEIVKLLSEIVRTKFSEMVDANGQKIGVNKKTAGEWIYSKDATALHRKDISAFVDKANAFENADELLKASKDYVGEAAKHARKDSFKEFARGTVSFEVEGRRYQADMIVGITGNGKAILYDLVNIQGNKRTAATPDTGQFRRLNVSAVNKKEQHISQPINAEALTTTPETRSSMNAVSENSISENTENVKATGEKNSLPENGEKVNIRSKKIETATNGTAQDRRLNATISMDSISENTENVKAAGEKNSLPENGKKVNTSEKKAVTKEDVLAITREIGAYKGLSEPARRSVRATIRQALAHGFSAEDAASIARVAAHSGLHIEFNSVQAAIGEAKFTGNTIYIDPKKVNHARLERGLLLHEVGHALLRDGGGRNLIAEAFRHIDPKRSQAVTERYMAEYRKEGRSLSDVLSIVDEEITTAHIEDALGSKRAWDYILSEKPDTEKGVLSFFRRAKNDYAEDMGLSREAGKLLRIYKKLFDEFAKRNRNGQGVERRGSSAGRYSLNDEYESDIDAWNKAGQPEREIFILGMTGGTLQGLGAMENPIYMTGEKIARILREHPEMTLDEIKRVPRVLENPVMVLKSRNVGRQKKQNTRLVLFGAVKAQNGLPLLSVLELRPNERGMVIEDMQKVDSAYTKTTNATDFIRNSEIMYLSKKKTASLLRTIGFYMPIELNESGFIGSIAYEGQNVNLTGKKFSEVFTEDTEERFSLPENTAKQKPTPKPVRYVHNVGGTQSVVLDTIGEYGDDIRKRFGKITDNLLAFEAGRAQFGIGWHLERVLEEHLVNVSNMRRLAKVQTYIDQYRETVNRNNGRIKALDAELERVKDKPVEVEIKLQAIEQLEEKNRSPSEKLKKLIAEREGLENYIPTVGRRLELFLEAYYRLRESHDPMDRMIYNDSTYEKLKGYYRKAGGDAVESLNEKQIKAVIEFLKEFEHVAKSDATQQKVVADSDRRIEKADKKAEQAQDVARTQIKKAREQRNEAVTAARLDAEAKIKGWKDAHDRAENQRKLLRTIGRLNTRLYRPTKTRHVPQGMRDIIFTALSSVDANTVSMRKLSAMQEKLDAMYREDVPNTDEIANLGARIIGFMDKDARI